MKILIALLMTLAPHSTDTETSAEREARMGIIAKAIIIAVDEQTCHGKFDVEGCKRKWKGTRKSLTIALVAQGKHETHFAEQIHAGNCRRFECDPIVIRDPLTGRIERDEDGQPVLKFLARGPWQVQARAPGMEQELWNRARGNSQAATTAGARLAAIYFGRRECGGDLVKMFQSMNGRGCRVGETGKLRAQTYNELMVKYDRIAWSHRNPTKAASL